MFFLADTLQKVDCIHRAVLTFCASLHFLRSVLVRISAISSSDSRKSHFFSSFLKKKKKKQVDGRPCLKTRLIDYLLPTQPRLRANIPSTNLVSKPIYHRIDGILPSSETQSVRSGERAGRKFSNTCERAPGYRLSRSYFQKSSGCWLLIGHKNALYYCAQSANSFS